MSAPDGSSDILDAEGEMAIRILIDDRLFIASLTQLTDRSAKIRQLSESGGIPPNGLRFLRFDAGIFEHVLRYIRYDIYPSFVLANGNADTGSYGILAQQAKELIIPLLEHEAERRAGRRKVDSEGKQRRWPRLLSR